MATTGEIQINALPQASLPLSLPDIFHLKQGVIDKRCTLEQLLSPHASRTDNPHTVTKAQVGLNAVTNDTQLAQSKNLSDILNKFIARTNLEVDSSTEVSGKVNAHANRTDNPHGVTKAQVGLSKVSNYDVSNVYTDNTDTFASSKALRALFVAIQNQNPVDSVYLSYSSANPATYLLCGGVWELASKGRAIVGAPTETGAGTQFGASSKNITTANLPSHSHTVNLTGGGHIHDATVTINGGGSHVHTAAGTALSAGDHAHSMNINTTTAPDHQHWFRDWYYPESTSIMNDPNWHITNFELLNGYNSNMGSSSSDRDNAGVLYKDKLTSGGGAHYHNISGNTNTTGAHTHALSVSVNAAPDHTHTGSVTVATSEHSHSGVSGVTGAGSAFNVEQASEYLYVWRRTA
ncbi:tail fiber protein [Yersinia phage vB_YenM_P778]